ncbi:MAG: hypothetical protein NT075_13230 [Chloroflexi bacterium]|nr:hypothetical protein [Chloroflexota bacterium]
MKYLLFKLTSLLVILSLCLSALPVYAQPLQQDNPASDYTYGDCSKLNQEALRTEIEKIAHQVLTDESNGLDIDTVVARHWASLNVDATINGEVERAVNQLSNDEGYFSRLWSGWSAEKAEEFATKIANDAFTSPTFKNKITELSNAIALEISNDIEANFARAASAAFLCMKAYVGERYSATLFSAFEDKVSVEIKGVNVADANPVKVNPTDVHGKALGGLGLIIVTEISRRIAQKLAEKIAQRIAGGIVERILGEAGASLIPIAGWIVGLGLIAWDLWQGGKGALPQIQEALEGEEVKAKIRNEITASVKDGLPQEVSIVSLEIAVDIMDDWNNFCTVNQYVCMVAGENSTFKQILDSTPLDHISALSTLVNTFIEIAGRSTLDSAIQNGQFEQLLALPAPALDILHTTKSVETTLLWAKLADDKLDRLVKYGVYLRKTPADFDQKLLLAVLNLDDNGAIQKLLELDHDQLAAIVDFAGDQLAPITLQTSTADIKQLATYLVQQPASQRPTAQAATALANGTLTVQKLIQPAVEAAAAPTPTAPPKLESVGAYPKIYAFLQPLVGNSVIVAAFALVLLILIAATVGFLFRRRKARHVDAMDHYTLRR